MIICERCGTKNNDNFNCCYNCGTPLNKKSAELHDDDAENQDQAIETENENILEELFDEADNMQDEQEEFEQHESAGSDEHVGEDEDEDINTVYTSTAYSDLQNTKYYNKNSSNPKPSKKKSKGSEMTLRHVVAIAVVVIIAVIVIWGVGKLLDNIFSGPVTSTPTPPASHDASSLYIEAGSIYDTDIYGDKFFRIAIRTNADKIYIMNKEYVVENGVLDLTLTEYDIYRTYKPTNFTKGDSFNAEIPILAQKEGFENYTYKLTVENVTTPMVPFNLISPSSTSATVYKTNTTISFETLSDVTIFLNGEDFTEGYFDASAGIFSIVQLTPIQADPYRFEIRIESDEYLARTVLLELTRSSEPDPNEDTVLELDQILYVAGEDDLVTVTGRFTGAHSDLQFYGRNTSAIETVSITFSENGDGAFTAVLKSSLLGWAEVMAECKTDFGLNKTFYIQNMSNNLGGFDKYSTTAWSVNSNYDALKTSDSNFAGQHFLITGTITKIEKVETGYAIYVNITPNAEEETLVYVELCVDTFTYEEGRSVRIFANRSMSHDDVPRFLAGYYK